MVGKSNVVIAWRLLYFTYGSLPIITGLDKYFDYIANWSIYVNSSILTAMNVSLEVFMHAVGIIEILAGVLVFFKPKIGGSIIIAWLIAISINLISMGEHTHHGFAHSMTHYDIALRDIVIAIGAYVFVILTKELKK